MEYHPYAGSFPMMSEEELQELAQDIKENAQLEVIVTCEGMILDGRNRYEACRIAGVEPETREYHGPDPLAFVVSKNLRRRQLTREQMIEVRRKLREQGWKYEEIAEATGCSYGTVYSQVKDVTPKDKIKIDITGRERPTSYRKRDVEPEQEEEDEEEDKPEPNNTLPRTRPSVFICQQNTNCPQLVAVDILAHFSRDAVQIIVNALTEGLEKFNA